MAKSRSASTGNPAGYSGTPLVKKLGIKEGARVVLVGAQPGFEKLIADLPPGATVGRQLAARASGGSIGRQLAGHAPGDSGGRRVRSARGRRASPARPDMILWFVRSQSELRAGARTMVRAFEGKSGLWIAWPKKTSKEASDLSENDVRAAGLAVGLVDFKVCAIDATWSGLRFARRSEPARAGAPRRA